jgi:hypothetical protein
MRVRFRASYRTPRAVFGVRKLACALFYERECQEQTSTLAAASFFLGIQPLRAPRKLPFLRMRPCGPLILVQFELRSLPAEQHYRSREFT